MHIVGEGGVTFTNGIGFTVTVTVDVFVHVFNAVPVTVYVVVNDGAAIIVVPVDALKPVNGDQLYAFAPSAVKVTEPPLHNVVDDGLIFT